MSSMVNKSGVGLKQKINKDGPSSSSSIAKTKIDSSDVNKKKLFSADPKLKSLSNSVSPTTEMKKKTIATTSSTKTVTKTVSKTREKKVFSLPGQKFDIPEEREPLRIFYESLSQQIPSSEMAEFWLMEHGLLSPERAKKALERKQRKQKQLRTGTPVKYQPPSLPVRPSESSKKQQVSKNGGDVKAKRRVLDDRDDDDEFIINKKRK